MATPIRRVVVVGGGFAGAYCARRFEKRLQSPRSTPVEVVLLDRNNYFVFHPLLVEAGIGRLHPRHVVVPLRSFLGRTRFLRAEVTGADVERRVLRLRRQGEQREEELAYDHLVLAPGSTVRHPPIDGLAEHALELKNLENARALRDRAVRRLEEADATDDPTRRRELLSFVVVGGNYTGVEVAGELESFLQDALHEYPRLHPDCARITLVEMEDRILRVLDEELGQYAARKLRERRVDVRTGVAVESIEARSVHLSDGGVLAACNVVWCAGIAPSPLLEHLQLPRDEGGWLRCEPDLRVVGREEVWGIGDCSVNPDPSGAPYPATAQHAVRMGAHCADNVLRVLEGRAPEPFVYDALGWLAALGCRTGVARVMGLRLSGFAAWFLWRTVYLMKMPGWWRRIRVAADWTLDLFSRPPVVDLGADRSSRRHP